ncbi:MAG: UDP-3-O-(3-hydroxymyristoyl)glucosamine N-acyltransferase [Alphaproteobacteria bacterium]|nr:UDP-3-O-(3-hydroxymyristoyl)glucosamine N-acyltransferase [Alphaproteobacteria bacterium]
MPDPRFFKKSDSKTLQQLAEIGGATLGQGADANLAIQDVAPLDMAGADDLSFFDNAKYKDQFKATNAGACFVSPKAAEFAPAGCALLISDHPYKSYALVAQAFYPEETPAGNVSEQASVDPSAKIGEGTSIEPFAVIGAGVEIGAGCRIEAGAVIESNVKIGAHCRIGSNATISHAVIGDYVRLYSGVRVGQDGFGFAIDPKGHVKVPQLGRVVIEDHVEVGANTCIDRGAGPDTVIGQGTWIDNLVQIGHNVKIGRGCVIVAQVGISGSTVIEDYVSLAGQVGIAGHLTIGRGAQVGAQAGVMRNIPPGEVQHGSPAMPIKQAMRQVAALNRLINKDK